MPHGECVILTLIRVDEAGETSQLAVGMKAVAAAGEYLVTVCLVTDIPYETVVRCIIQIMKCYRQLYSAQTGAKMTGVERKLFNNELSQVSTNGFQLFNRKLFQIIRAVYLLQIFHATFQFFILMN